MLDGTSMSLGPHAPEIVVVNAAVAKPDRPVPVVVAGLIGIFAQGPVTRVTRPIGVENRVETGFGAAEEQVLGKQFPADFDADAIGLVAKLNRRVGRSSRRQNKKGEDTRNRGYGVTRSYREEFAGIEGIKILREQQPDGPKTCRLSEAGFWVIGEMSSWSGIRR